jgi:hypothetical protein
LKDLPLNEYAKYDLILLSESIGKSKHLEALEIGNAVAGLDWDMILNSHVNDSSSSASILQDISIIITH